MEINTQKYMLLLNMSVHILPRVSNQELPTNAWNWPTTQDVKDVSSNQEW